MEGSIFSAKVNESVVKEMMESGASVGVSLMLFSVCLGMVCFVLIFLAWIDGIAIRKIISKNIYLRITIKRLSEAALLLSLQPHTEVWGFCMNIRSPT